MSLLPGSAPAPTSSDEVDERTSDAGEGPGHDAEVDGPQRAALAALYKGYAPAIYARCYRLLHSGVAARDAVQETFARLLGHNRSVLTGDSGLHYLYRVSTNVCFNLLREQRVRERAAPMLASLVSAPVSPERGHVDRQFALAILARCDETSAAIAVLHYIDGMNQSEVADVLSITRRTVFNRLRKLESMALALLGAPRGQRKDQI
ncbi:MAG TPA: sigma-70 family RNA polymerase sigma factor [Polyangia bacterium]|nr:sigma-70 family RNA polymerase sigma factor [Polyangia bacterium]